MGVKKSKPENASRLFESKVEKAIESAKKTVQNAQASIQRSKTILEIARETVEETKRRRRA